MTSRKGEQKVNDKIMGALNCYHPVRIEDMYSTGIPDINFTGGWIESKDIPADRAPKKLTTIVRLPHYTPQQRGWQVHRHTCGGKIYVALEVSDEFFLFQAFQAAQHLGIDWTLGDLPGCALLWQTRFDGSELRQFLRLDCKLP